MLNISDLGLGYNGNPVVYMSRLQLPKGSQCLITGASGSGKTTLLYAIAGLIPVMQGKIAINGREITALSENQRDSIRGKHIGMIFQTLHLIKSLSVLDNLLLASYACGVAPERARAETLLKKLGIHDKRNDLPERLSQGQAQRVAIARAVMHKPGLILADEPTSSLDDSACQMVIRLIKEIAIETNATLVISTHDNRIKPHFDTILHVGRAP
jgi:putative ABC transport system ATP-binding protein